MFEQIKQRFPTILEKDVSSEKLDVLTVPEREYYDGPDGEVIDSQRYHILTPKGWLAGCRQKARMASPTLKTFKEPGQSIISYLIEQGVKPRDVQAVVKEHFHYDSRNGFPNNYQVSRMIYRI